MKLVFIINNKQDRLRKRLPELLYHFDNKYSGQVEFLYTQGTKHAIELAKKSAEMGCDYLIAVGGDGTLHEVVNGVMQSGVGDENYPIIGLLPWGSANDFARTAGLTPSVESLARSIDSHSIRRIDVGQILSSRVPEARYFINVAGIGLGPEVVLQMERSEPKLGPALHYFGSIVKGFLKYRKKRVICSAGSWRYEGRLLQLAVGNGRYLGHGICITPDALLDDGKFELAIFGDLSLWDYLRKLGKLKKGIKIDHPEVQYHSADSLRMESPDSCGIEADGEYVGLLPANIKVLPGALRFLFPA
ncbi:lipid kinase, YegS/Rv2252/BmrU family [Muriicola jejuensis]|uniref:YegS/Rv2252/BmrU family lipid kinase n=1 Tax=Muriicola jejuensis TaxID=504488 RepID=A0A6P0UG87_9FLAO|nr:diacylglycerol kinase family protein [Muriicola jejuensis]NER11450.1 YegS/Rv2252/BmrU family lipid kinase [Muriicola jejuensis]SMP20720.1 lipid kinase, YegS/Rv2252/BmrU family [Muriicola jejuensis]